MRSNGAVHIGNDTFLAATDDVTDSLFLFSSCFPAEEQLASLPLVRKVRFSPHVTLPCTAAELEHYTAAARELGKARADPAPGGREKRTSEVPTTPLFRHSLHASPDGHQVAVISNVQRHHYIIDIDVEPAAVCALEMPEIVRSVCWHPVTQHVLYVLLVSGDMIIYDTSRSRMGVVLPRYRRVNLRSPIQQCLAEAEGVVSDRTEKAAPPLSHLRVAAPSTSAATAASTTKTRKCCAVDTKKGSDNRGRNCGPQGTSRASSAANTPRPYLSPSVYTPSTNVSALPLYTVHASNSPTIDTLLASHVASTPSRGVAERQAFDEVIPIDSDSDDELIEGVAEGSVATAGSTVVAGARDTVQRRTEQTDLVDLHVVAPTHSIPATLLLLSSSGDVYTMHLSKEDMLPTLATPAAIDDGRVRTFKEERSQLSALAEGTAGANIEVYHLIKGELAATYDEALAVGSCLVDADAGTHAVFFCTAGGTVRGAWVSEPDLLARHRAVTAQPAGAPNLSFTVHLDGRGSAVREYLSPAVPSTTHTVTMTQSHNLCLLRCGETGEASYLLAFPCWDRHRNGWSCWWPTCKEARTTAVVRGALPLLSTDNAVPPPIALRLPYDTRGSSVALGEQELILAPKILTPKPKTGERHSIFIISLLSLLRSALYARCGTLQMHPAAGDMKSLPATAGAAEPAKSDAVASRELILKLVNALPLCHRRWLCAAPQDEVDAATVELATLVERQVKNLEQRERMQGQRRERLIARVAVLEGRLSEMNLTFDRWQQTLLDAIVHRRGAAAVRTANERLGEVHMMLNEWEHQQ
ncbi:hypothetical protein ABL78_6578 [Leptomonas seymouri]|uniref:Uncharacterized protein n=1 Tax=Leptomonas seymouri TaxID=5684 RepID=A0A0N1IIR5_LEPSE|nr:hypothetical protein ABL78_6578 [Leptomonas seymouri]|eukprot:KPI84371.1 hypothetical protein ABL78_6578 [Leptomonas seymouri]